MYYFKLLGFVAEDNIRPTTSKNKTEKIKKDQGLLVGYKILKDEFIIVVDTAEFQKIMEQISKGDMRGLGFKQNKPFNLPSDSKESLVPKKKTLKMVRQRLPPSPSGGESYNDSDGDKNLDKDRPREKSPGQQSWEKTTGIT